MGLATRIGSLALMSLVLAGCGSSSSGSSSASATGTLSRSAIAARANTICKQATTAIGALGGLPSDFNANAISAAAYLDKAVPITDRAVEELAALHPDSQVSAQWQIFIADNQAARKSLDTARAKAHAKDPSGIQNFAAATGALSKRVDTSARAIGASNCAD